MGFLIHNILWPRGQRNVKNPMASLAFQGRPEGGLEKDPWKAGPKAVNDAQKDFLYKRLLGSLLKAKKSNTENLKWSQAVAWAGGQTIGDEILFDVRLAFSSQTNF